MQVFFHFSVARSGNSFTRLWRSVTPLSTCSLKRASWSVSGSNPSLIILVFNQWVLNESVRYFKSR